MFKINEVHFLKKNFKILKPFFKNCTQNDLLIGNSENGRIHNSNWTPVYSKLFCPFCIHIFINQQKAISLSINRKNLFNEM